MNPIAIVALQAQPRAKNSAYPKQFHEMVAGREKRILGDIFGLQNFGVNLTRLAPNSASSLRHAHAKQDEFIYILQGHPTLLTDAGPTQLSPGMCAGFAAGTGNAHQLINLGSTEVLYLEVGDRSAGDQVMYPDHDLKAVMQADGSWKFVHKDGSDYAE